MAELAEQAEAAGRSPQPPPPGAAGGAGATVCEVNADMVIRLLLDRFAFRDDLAEVPCDQCPGRFRSKKDLAIHSSVHQPAPAGPACPAGPSSSRALAPPFRCKACGHRFQDEVTRDWHFLSHGPRPFVCFVPGCDFKFAKEKQRFAHVQEKHEGRLRYRCRDCQLDFPCCCDLHVHSCRTHSAPYACPRGSCSVRNTHRGLFEEHLADHMGLLPARRVRTLLELMALVSAEPGKTQRALRQLRGSGAVAHSPSSTMVASVAADALHASRLRSVIVRRPATASAVAAAAAAVTAAAASAVTAAATTTASSPTGAVGLPARVEDLTPSRIGNSSAARSARVEKATSSRKVPIICID